MCIWTFIVLSMENVARKKVYKNYPPLHFIPQIATFYFLLLFLGHNII